MAKLKIEEVNQWIEDYMRINSVSSPVHCSQIDSIVAYVMNKVKTEKSIFMYQIFDQKALKHHIIVYLIKMHNIKISSGVLTLVPA